MKNADCHPDRRHVARGLCPSCYQMWYVKERALGGDEIHQARIPECHPDRGHMAKGLCAPCYAKENQQARRHRRYGITVQEFNKIVATQGEQCAICGDAEKRLVIDHNHTSGKVRSLLCHGCNTMVGYFETRPHLIEAVRDYVAGHQAIAN